MFSKQTASSLKMDFLWLVLAAGQTSARGQLFIGRVWVGFCRMEGAFQSACCEVRDQRMWPMVLEQMFSGGASYFGL